MITFANIVDRFETFVERHFFLKSFSFGSPEDLDLDKFENFPLCHLVYTSGSYADKVKSYTLEVYILDCPRGEESRKEFEKDAITQSELAAEDILADLENGGNIFDFDFAYNLESASITPLEEMETNVLSGTLLQISIGVPYLYDTCNAPLTGVSPQGTNTTFSARGLLRVKEVDGSPDVTTVKTINVSNGTLTDNGSGEVTIDTGGGGASSLNDLSDVNLSGTSDDELLIFDSTTGKFENKAQSTLAAGSAASVTGSQASEITANTAKTSFPGFGTTAGTALEGDTTTISGAQASAITANTAKTSFPGFGTTAGTALEGNTTLTTSLDNLTDVDLTSTANNQTLVFNSTSGKFENGFPVHAGQVTQFKRTSNAAFTQTFAGGASTNLEFGTFLAGGVTYDNQLRAGVAFGFNNNANLMQMLPVSVGSTIQVELEYEITLDSAGLAAINSTVTGSFSQVGFSFPNETAAGTVSRTITSNTADVVFFSTTNTIKFAVVSTVAGTWNPTSIKIIVNHA